MMATLPIANATVSEFVFWWERQENERARYELVDGAPLLIDQDNVGIGIARMHAYSVVRDAVERARADCKVYGRGVGVSPDDSNYLLPDVAVDLGPSAPDEYILRNPLIIADIVSSRRNGRSTHSKLRSYFAIKSLRHYLVIDLDRELVIHHRRKGDGEVFETAFVSSGAIELTPPGISVSVVDMFGEVDR